MEKGNEAKLKATAEALKNLDLKEFQYHKKEIKQVVSELKTDLARGLSSQEAQKRLAEHGPNQL
jgi:magnesium-transporting ATPase (P-type)